MNFAMQSPGCVRRLVLLCPGLPSLGPATARWALHGLPMMLLPSRLTAHWLVQGMTVKGVRPGDPEAEQIMAGAMHLRSRIPFRPAFDDHEFAALTMPVLLLVGDREAMYEPNRAVEQARKLFPNIEAEMIKNAGHMLTTDQPEAVIERVTRFLQA